MNREILFKAKKKDNGKWVEGLPGYDMSGNIAEIETHKSFGDCRIYEIDPDTICQYTGLTDKNGQKIWENDILRNEEGDIGVVQWFEEHTAFMIWNKTKNCVCYLAENDFSKIEIAGNEFDNPELLEVE